jgi:hypothetical protein
LVDLVRLLKVSSVSRRNNFEGCESAKRRESDETGQ